jgi:hypothetical protein
VSSSHVSVVDIVQLRSVLHYRFYSSLSAIECGTGSDGTAFVMRHVGFSLSNNHLKICINRSIWETSLQTAICPTTQTLHLWCSVTDCDVFGGSFQPALLLHLPCVSWCSQRYDGFSSTGKQSHAPLASIFSTHLFHALAGLASILTLFCHRGLDHSAIPKLFLRLWLGRRIPR